MDIIFSFDTEDYLTPEAWDAQKWWADELHSRGIRGCFQCVAELIRTLRRNGRDDVIAGLANHEIGNHTNYHSKPPTHPQALVDMPLDAAVEWVVRTEAASFATLEETFGRVPITYCSPGDSWTPATVLAFAAMGAKVYCDCHFAQPHAPRWYCGMLMSYYNLAFESYYTHTPNGEQDFKNRVSAEISAAGGQGLLTIYSHPTALVTTQFWDAIFFNGANPKREEWRPAPLRPAEQVQDNKDRIRRWLDWLQARDDVRFIDNATMYAEHVPNSRRDLDDLLRECRLKPGQAGRLPLREPAAESLALLNGLETFRHDWGCYPNELDTSSICKQAEQLAWTAAE